jgi:CrcB protein
VLAVISAGGGVGSLARWGLTLVWPASTIGFPVATAVANVIGCLAIGVLMVFVLDILPPSRYTRPFLGVGVLGGFTTFSSAMLDTRAQLVARHQAQACGYLFGSLLAGLMAVWLGMALARSAVVAVRGIRGFQPDRHLADPQPPQGPDDRGGR